eukprot:CAMPEP_0194034112 /NCGR_PEP_ID=MMETSP0009_2-20130614/6521_1 /TAXON_ID=210454 /ORGANISM="Grammatophora oceanica, Strain CCMP 410" /LENGTH=616 /DNA_ID=CAMNT_0038674879 /DNA_START=56 /DNA_END=1903 /DNA_ORIENTATION=+
MTTTSKPTTMLSFVMLFFCCLFVRTTTAEVSSAGPVRVKLPEYSLTLVHEEGEFDTMTVFQANQIRDIAEELLEMTLEETDFGAFAEYQTAHLSSVDRIDHVDETKTTLLLRGGLVVFKQHTAVPPSEESLEAILAETLKQNLGEELHMRGYDTVSDVVYTLEEPFPTTPPSPVSEDDDSSSDSISELTKDDLKIGGRDRTPKIPILLGCIVGFLLATILLAGFAMRRRSRQRRRYEEWKEDAGKELQVKELSSFDDEAAIQGEDLAAAAATPHGSDKNSEGGFIDEDRMSNGSGSESVGSSRLGRMLTSLGRLSSIREESDEDGTTKDISEEEEALSFASTSGGIRTVEPSIIPLDQVESFEHARNASQHNNRIQKDMLATSGTAGGGGGSSSWASYISMLMGTNNSNSNTGGQRNQALAPTDSSAAALASSDENNNSFYGFAPWFAAPTTTTSNDARPTTNRTYSGSDDDSGADQYRADDAWNFNDNDRDSNDSGDDSNNNHFAEQHHQEQEQQGHPHHQWHQDHQNGSNRNDTGEGGKIDHLSMMLLWKQQKYNMACSSSSPSSSTPLSGGVHHHHHTIRQSTKVALTIVPWLFKRIKATPMTYTTCTAQSPL